MIQTQTIDISYVKKILASSPHYQAIIDYEYPMDDELSKKLIDWYKDLIFSANSDNKDQLMLIQILDRSLYLYVKNNQYKKGIRKIINVDELTLKNKDSIKEVIKKIVIYTNNFENKEVREVTTSKWL